MSNYLKLEDDEEVIVTVALRDEDKKDKYLVFVTKKGLIKRIAVDQIPRKNGTSCKMTTLRDGDEIADVQLAPEDAQIIIASRNGYATRFNLNLVKPSGRGASGMKGMKIKDEGDCVVGFTIVDPNKEYFASFSDNGCGKKTKISEINEIYSRNGKGVIAHKLDTNSHLVDIVSVNEEDDVLVTTTANTLIRVSVESLSTFSRTAGGSKVVFLENDQDIKSIAVIPNQNILEEAE